MEVLWRGYTGTIGRSNSFVCLFIGYFSREDVEAPTSTYIAGADELLASRHHDSISVATILTPFTMLSFNEYCRWVISKLLHVKFKTAVVQFQILKYIFQIQGIQSIWKLDVFPNKWHWHTQRYWIFRILFECFLLVSFQLKNLMCFWKHKITFFSVVDFMKIRVVQFQRCLLF